MACGKNGKHKAGVTKYVAKKKPKKKIRRKTYVAKKKS